MASNRSIRLSDVAAVAGVSLSTASKALSGTDRISEETRQRVRDVAERLDFRPDALARSFARGQSDTVGMLTRRAGSTFASPVVLGAALRLGADRLATLIYDADTPDPRQMSERIRELQARRIDGLIVVGDGHEFETASITHHFDIPVVYAYDATDNPADRMFLPDNDAIGRMAARHLLERGRTRIAHITAGAERIAVQRRERGMRAELEAHGLVSAAAPLYGQWTREWGSAATERLLDGGATFDALFCGNDLIALGAIEVLEGRGISVPDDVAVVGVDNWEGIVVNQPYRRLTTIDPELRTLGRRAAEELLRVGGEPGEQLIAPSLAIGTSS